MFNSCQKLNANAKNIEYIYITLYPYIFYAWFIQIVTNTMLHNYIFEDMCFCENEKTEILQIKIITKANKKHYFC